MYLPSPSCSLTPPPPSPYVGLITCWYRISGSTPAFACALGFVLRMPDSIVRFMSDSSVQNSLRSSLWNDLKKPCCQIAGTCSTTCTCSLVCSNLSQQVFGMFLEKPDDPFPGWVHAV